MKIGLRVTLLVTLLTLLTLITLHLIMVDTLASDAPDMKSMAVDSTVAAGDKTSTPDMASVPVKLVWLIDYPVGGRDDYLAWGASVREVLLSPEELMRAASYENLGGTNPHRLVEFEFANFADASTYLNRPEVAAVSAALPNYTSSASAHVFVQRGNYVKNESAGRNVKIAYLVDYPLGGKAEYLEWVASNVTEMQTPDQVKRIASYDNYYGVSPHRFVEFEFDSVADAHDYVELPAIREIAAEFPDRATRASVFTFELRVEYPTESGLAQ